MVICTRQVWGAKQILVCQPEDSSRLYPFTTRVLRNTSQVDMDRVGRCEIPGLQRCYVPGVYIESR